MASFSDSPLEIIAEIINALQDDISALEACSQTCSLLLPLCRKYIFRSIHISAPYYPQRSLRPRLIKLFGILLENNPEISDLVRNFVFYMCSPDAEDDDVLRVLGKLHHLHSFELGIGDLTIIQWNALRHPLRDVLSGLIQLPSLSRLHISYIYDFPITLFFPCINLADLTLSCITKPTMAVRYEEDISVPEAAPQLQSFAFRRDHGSYTMYLLNARRPNGVPVLDFSKVRTLTVEADREQNLVAIQALVRTTKQLETLQYTTEMTQGYTGFAASMNASSLSTLRTLRLQHDIEDDIQDPLCGICEEFSIISGRNVIEEIFLDIFVQTDCQCKTGSEWGELDTVLSRGFPKLRAVSLDIQICVFAPSFSETILQERVNEIPRKYFPWLSSNVQVTFKFSSDVYWV